MTIIGTPLGSLRGVAHDGILRFRGVRYGEPTTGARRFLPASPATGWDGVWDATEFGPRAPQPPGPDLLGPPAGEERQDEDCLFLDVYTPGAEGSRPVLVWIHGGGYELGAGSDHDASVLSAQGDVVVVCINYRLGILGFADLSRLDASLEGSASNGINDQVLALRWVRDNISAFGGEPGNVTIAGESAGASCVLGLLGAPSAAGLFHRAIVASPPGFMPHPIDAVPQLVAALDVSEGELLERLRAMPAGEIASLHQVAQVAVTGVVDGVVVTRHFEDAIRAAGSAAVPLLVGSTRDEGTLLTEVVPPEFYEPTTLGIAASVIGGQDPTSYLTALDSRFPSLSPSDRHTLVWTHLFRRTATRVADVAAEGGGSAWLYRFDHPTTKWGDRLGATHGSDLPFIFNDYATPVAQPSDMHDRHSDRVSWLAETWSSTLLAFIRSGDPNGAGLPRWPRYERSGRRCLYVDVESTVGPDELDLERLLWGDALAEDERRSTAPQ